TSATPRGWAASTSKSRNARTACRSRSPPPAARTSQDVNATRVVPEESAMKKSIYVLPASCALVAVTVGLLIGQQPSTPAAPKAKSGGWAAIEKKAAKKGKQAGTANAGDPADVAAIKNTTQAFIKSLASGDAKAVAAYWTENGEYQVDDGTTLRGRAAIE